MGQFWALSRGLFLNFWRDKQAVIFSLLFPVIFLLLFGFIFSGEEGGRELPVLAVYIGDSAGADRLKEVLEEDSFTVRMVESSEQVLSSVREGSAHFGLLAEESGALHFHYNPTRIQRNSYYQRLAEGIAAEYNMKRAGFVEFVELSESRVAYREGLTQLEYMLPGIIALGILSTGMFAVTASFMHLKEKGILKRMAATPMHRTYFLLGLMVTRILVSIVSAVLILALGRFLFGLVFSIRWIEFIGFVIAATMAMIGVGFLISFFTTSAQSANEVAGILLTIMIFFSGIYFPLEFLPDYFQKLGRLLPLYYTAEGLRHIMDLSSMSGITFLSIILGFLLTSGLIISIASKQIRWEEGG